MAYCWDLPEGVMYLIMDCLEHYGDVVRCQAVCTSWYNVAHSVLNKISGSVPLLLLPNPKQLDQDQDPCTRTLLNAHNKTSLTVHLPELHDRWICCTTNGWLVTMGLSRPYPMHLLNPLSRAQISIPSRSTFRYPQLDGDDPDLDGEDEMYTPIPGFIKSAILSTAPSDPNCTLLVIYGNSCHLALCKIGDETWTHVEDTTGLCKCNDNLVYHKATGMFYITDNVADIKKLELELELVHPKPKALRIASPLEAHLDRKYLAESLVSGDLWLVLRTFHITDDMPDDWQNTMWYDTVSFTVLRMDSVTKEMSRVDSLGQEVLFLGHNGSISVIVDGEGWCRPNCIYFLDDYVSAYSRSSLGCYDMGVFDLATTRVEKQEFVSMPVGKMEFALQSRICTNPFYWIDTNM